MKNAHKIAIELTSQLTEAIKNEPIEVLLAFAGLFSALCIHCNIPEEDSMNLIRNIYKDVYADSQMGMH
jgi:ATP phosphoribosyltransferase regulatory subunit HisZ